MSLRRLALLAAPLLVSCNAVALPPRAQEDARPWTDRFQDPVSAPITFESPVVHTSVRPIFLHHEFHETGLLDGGYLRGVAVQARYAVTDRLAVIAVKDGRFKLDTGGKSPIPDGTGYADIGGGVKYVVHEDPDSGSLYTVGLIYEGTNGDRSVLQGNGEGMWRPFVSGAWNVDTYNVVATVGANLPVSGGDEPQTLDWHLHFSPDTEDDFVPLIEVNGIHYMNEGRNLPVNFEGVDYASLGSTMVKGHDVITGAVGFRYAVTEMGKLGFAYEHPLTSREDIFDDRYTVDWMQRF